MDFIHFWVNMEKIYEGEKEFDLKFKQKTFHFNWLKIWHKHEQEVWLFATFYLILCLNN